MGAQKLINHLRPERLVLSSKSFATSKTPFHPARQGGNRLVIGISCHFLGRDGGMSTASQTDPQRCGQRRPRLCGHEVHAGQGGLGECGHFHSHAIGFDCANAADGHFRFCPSHRKSSCGTRSARSACGFLNNRFRPARVARSESVSKIKTLCSAVGASQGANS